MAVNRPSPGSNEAVRGGDSPEDVDEQADGEVRDVGGENFGSVGDGDA